MTATKPLSDFDGAGSATADEIRAEIAMWADKDDAEYYANRKDIGKRLGIPLSEFDRLRRAEREKRAKRQDCQPQDMTPDTPALKESARRIIDAPDVLSLFISDWRNIIAGEERTAKTLFLAGTSRLFSKTMHVAVKGPSSASKSEIRDAVLEFFPPEAVIAFTSLSEKALIYSDESFEHKILSMGEAVGTDEQDFQDYLLRELMSSGRLVHRVTQKIGDEMVAVTIEKEGPVTFFVTTTRHKLHPENETRMLSVEIDDSENQTRAVLGKVAAAEGLGITHSTIDFTPWHDFQRLLAAGERNVVIPFAPVLAEMVPAIAVRLRRDFGQILRAIKAHALLHQYHRERDERGRIIAKIEHDYAAILDLMADLLAETAGTKIPDNMKETIDAVSRLTASLDSNEGITAVDAGKALRLDKSSARRRLSAGVSDGYLVNLETRRGHPGKYRVSNERPDPVQMLPDPEVLRHAGDTITVLPPPKFRPPCHRSDFTKQNQSDNGGKPPCHRFATDGTGGNGGTPPATGLATVESPRNPGKIDDRWQGNREFEEGGPGAQQKPSLDATDEDEIII